jgi:hypothetical protein
VIALRRGIERGVRHPVFGPLCLILFALLLALTVAHGLHDQFHDGELVACVAFVVIGAIVSLVLPPLAGLRSTRLVACRAPPQVCPRVEPRLAVVAPIPLRR